MRHTPRLAKFLAGFWAACWLAAALGGWSCGPSNTAVAPPRPLQDLHSLAEFRELFNRDAAKPRLVLLLSPT